MERRSHGQFQVIPRNFPRETQKNAKNLRDAGLLAEVRSPDLPNKQ